MSNKYVNSLRNKQQYGAVDSPEEMVKKMGKILGIGVASVAGLAGVIFLVGKLGDKHKIDDKIRDLGSFAKKKKKWADISEAEFQQVQEYVTTTNAPLGAIAASVGIEEEELKRNFVGVRPDGEVIGIGKDVMELIGGNPFDNSDVPYNLTIKKLPPIKRKPLSDEQRDLQNQRNIANFLSMQPAGLPTPKNRREPIDHDPFANLRFKK
jgi:hypothetical protein